ncbi:unnamed protein product [Diatraea saccharalis]|uniref:GATA zinc finger domain-containing protein 14-like n=1 Tax=Diatraea saccharalis TaxID=40085 RepID=A0A9N9R7Y6_9NEOP|nr:unnamed protein product [Diatraea saccharalis]
MNLSYFLFYFLLTVTQKCEGQIPILSDILNGAKEIGSKVQNAIHGAAHGFEVSVQTQPGAHPTYNRPGHQPHHPMPPHHPNPHHPMPPHHPIPPHNGGGPESDTLIVVIEEQSPNNYGHRPQPNQQYGQNRPMPNNPHRPPNHHQPGYPPQYNNGNYNDNNYGYHKPTNNGNFNPHNYGNTHPNNYGPTNQNNYGNNNPNKYGPNNPSNYGNTYPYNYGNKNPNNYGNSKPNNYGNMDPNNYENQKPNVENSNTNIYENTKPNNYGGSKPNYESNDNKDAQKPIEKPQTKPDYGTIYDPTKENSEKPIDHSPTSNGNDKQESTTKPQKEDKPFFVPLNPNQYVYGGDKIEVNAPKRETNENKPAEDDEEAYPIDIRVGDRM